jgi:chemotaxis protein histidine kinase CheA
MIKKHLLKVTLVTTVIATLLTATACGSKQTSDNTTGQQTTEAVKVVSNVDVKTEAEKPNEEADKQPEQTEEEKEEQIEQPEENAEAVNTEAEVNAGEVNEAQNTVSEEVQEEQAAPAEQPAEAPAENNNAGAVDTTPEEQPAAPAEPSPVPEPTPEPVVTPQEPAKPSVTQEQQLVATGKWTKIMEWNDGAECRVYEYKDDITGYSVRASFADGEFYLEQWNSLEEEKAIYSAHGITDNVVSFDRLMKLSNS